MRKILVFGPQGSGKGTQAKRIAEKLGVPAISMGQLLREEIARGTELGKHIEPIVHGRGELIPGHMALQVFEQRFSQPDCKDGYVFDGYPRTIDEYKDFEAREAVTDVLLIDVPHDVSLARMLERAKIENRPDDTAELIEHRLDIYERETKPVLEEYAKRGLLTTVDGTGSIDEIAARIVDALHL